jgi:hypothetical protein
MKYIIIEVEKKDGTKIMVPVVFGEMLTHKDVYEGLNMTCTWRSYYTDYQSIDIVSAGFYNGKHCFGESESLGVGSRNDDLKIIQNH